MNPNKTLQCPSPPTESPIHGNYSGKGGNALIFPNLFSFHWLPCLFLFIQSPISTQRKGGKDFFFSGMVALLLSWQLLFDHLRKSQGPNTSSPWFPRLLSQRLWSDSISNVLLLHKHSWEQCTSLDIQSRKSVSCQKSSPIILSRHLPSAVSSLALKFLLHKFKHVCFPLRQSLLVICGCV